MLLHWLLLAAAAAAADATLPKVGDDSLATLAALATEAPPIRSGSERRRQRPTRHMQRMFDIVSAAPSNRLVFADNNQKLSDFGVVHAVVSHKLQALQKLGQTLRLQYSLSNHTSASPTSDAACSGAQLRISQQWLPLPAPWRTWRLSLSVCGRRIEPTGREFDHSHDEVVFSISAAAFGACSLRHRVAEMLLHAQPQPQPRQRRLRRRRRAAAGRAERPQLISYHGRQQEQQQQRRRRRRRRRQQHGRSVGFYQLPHASPDISVVCQRRRMRVSFADIGWDSWIIAPQGFDAGVCSGQCPFPLSDAFNATNHALVQMLLHSSRPRLANPPTCVPVQLRPQTILYFGRNGDVVLKTFGQMVVGHCGCR